MAASRKELITRTAITAGIAAGGFIAGRFAERRSARKSFPSTAQVNSIPESLDNAPEEIRLPDLLEEIERPEVPRVPIDITGGIRDFQRGRGREVNDSVRQFLADRGQSVDENRFVTWGMATESVVLGVEEHLSAVNDRIKTRLEGFGLKYTPDYQSSLGNAVDGWSPERVENRLRDVLFAGPESEENRENFEKEVQGSGEFLEFAHIRANGVEALERLLEHQELPNLVALYAQTAEDLAEFPNFDGLRGVSEDQTTEEKLAAARRFLEQDFQPKDTGEMVKVDDYARAVRTFVTRVDGMLEMNGAGNVDSYIEVSDVISDIKLVQIGDSETDPLATAVEHLDGAGRIIANEFIDTHEETSEALVPPVLAVTSDEEAPADGSASDRTDQEVSDSGPSNESNPVDPNQAGPADQGVDEPQESVLPPLPVQPEGNGRRRGRRGIRGLAGRMASSRSIRAGLISAVLGGSAVAFVDHQINHSGGDDNGPKNVRTIERDQLSKIDERLATIEKKVDEINESHKKADQATDADSSKKPEDQSRKPDEQKPSTQPNKIENSSQLSPDQAKKVLDGKDRESNGKLRIKISKKDGFRNIDTVDWRISGTLNDGNFRSEDPAINGISRWRITSAAIADQKGKTVEDFHWVDDGQEIDFEIGENLIDAYIKAGVPLTADDLKLVNSNTSSSNTPTSAEILPMPELDPALLLQLGGSLSQTVMPEDASFNLGKSNLNGSIKISGVTNQGDQTISAWEDKDKDKHPKPKPTKTPTVKPTVTVTPTLTPTPTATPVYVPPVVPVPDFDVPIPTPTVSPTPRPTATPTPKPETGIIFGKFIDANRNGKYDAGEIGTKAKINVDGPGRNDFTIETDFAGNAAVPVIPGTYIICEEVPEQWEVTTEGFPTMPECQIVVLAEGETRGVLFGNRIKPPVEPPMPPMTGLSKGDSFEAKRVLNIKEADAKDRIVGLQVLRGDNVVAGGNVDLAEFGPARVVIKGQPYDLNTWNVSLNGDFGQLIGGGTEADDNQDQVAIHDRVDTGANPIGEVVKATELKKVEVGDRIVKEMADGRKVEQTVRFAGVADPRAFFNKAKNSTIITTCTDDSGVENPARFVVYAESIETVNPMPVVDSRKRVNAEVSVQRVSEEAEIDEIMAKFAAMQQEREQAQDTAFILEDDDEDSPFSSKSTLLTAAVVAAGALQVARGRIRKIRSRR